MAPKLLAMAASPRWAEHADDEFLTNTKTNPINNIHTTASTADDDEEEDDDFFATDAELVAALDAATAVVMTTSGVSVGGAGAAVGVNSGATTPRVDAAAALLVHGDEFSLRFFLPAYDAKGEKNCYFFFFFFFF
jgi:hypothetical protein